MKADYISDWALLEVYLRVHYPHQSVVVLSFYSAFDDGKMIYKWLLSTLGAEKTAEIEFEDNLNVFIVCDDFEQALGVTLTGEDFATLWHDGEWVDLDEPTPE